MTQSDLIPLAIAAISLSTFGVSAVKVPLDRMTPPAIEGSAVVVSPVRPGQVITVPWLITKRVQCQGVSGRVWSGEKGFSMTEPLRPSSLPALGRPVTHNIQTQIPELAPAGTLVLKVAGYFDCPGNTRLWWEIGPVTMVVAP